MKKKQNLKLIGYGVLAILILNLLLFALQVINWILFWGIIILGALFVYKVLPKMRKS